MNRRSISCECRVRACHNFQKRRQISFKKKKKNFSSINFVLYKNKKKKLADAQVRPFHWIWLQVHELRLKLSNRFDRSITRRVYILVSVFIRMWITFQKKKGERK